MDGLFEDPAVARKVLGVNDVARAPAFQFLERSSGIFEDVPVAELEPAVWGQERDQTRNAVQHQARIAFGVAQRFFRTSRCGGIVFPTARSRLAHAAAKWS